MIRIWLLAALACAGCEALPRDVDGTSDRIAAARIVRVGIDAPLTPQGERFLSALQRATGARAVRSNGSLETMIAALDRGALDVVVAPVRADALLASEAALGPPLDGSDAGDRPIAIRAMVRNGENRWVMTIERASRAAARERSGE